MVSLPCRPCRPINQASYTIYAGRLQLNGFNQYETSHSMKNIMIAPGYNTPQSGNDVALVQLDPPVSWTNVIQPICIPGSGVSFSEGQSCYVTGWGDIRDGGEDKLFLLILLYICI